MGPTETDGFMRHQRSPVGLQGEAIGMRPRLREIQVAVTATEHTPQQNRLDDEIRLEQRRILQGDAVKKTVPALVKDLRNGSALTRPSSSAHHGNAGPCGL